MSCIFFRENIPDDDDEFLSSFQKYITAKKNNTLGSLKLSSEECEYILDKLYKDGLKLDLLIFSEIAVDMHPFSDEILVRRCNVLTDNGYADLSVDLLKSKKGFFLDSKLYKTAYINSYILLEEYEKAENIAKNFLKFLVNDTEDNSEIADDFINFGLMCMERGNYADATFYFNSIEKFFWPSIDVLLYLADCYKKLDVERETIASYYKQLEDNPYNHFLWYKLGFLQFKFQFLDSAIESLKNSLVISPNSLEALKLLSEIYFELSMNSEGLSTIKKYLDLDFDEDRKNDYLYSLCCYFFSIKKSKLVKWILPFIKNFDDNKIRCVELSIKIVEEYANYKDPKGKELEKLVNDIEEISTFDREWISMIIGYSNYSYEVSTLLYDKLRN